VRKSFRWLGHVVPQVLGQNQFHGAYIKQDIKWKQDSNTWKNKLTYDIWLKQKLDTFKDSTWHTQRHKHVAIMHLNSWIWGSKTKHPKTCYPTTFRSLKRWKNRSQTATTEPENVDSRILGRSDLCSLIWS